MNCSQISLHLMRAHVDKRRDPRLARLVLMSAQGPLRPIQLICACALEKLSSRPLLREIILSEEDSLEPSEFVAKMQIWLKLFSAESRG